MLGELFNYRDWFSAKSKAYNEERCKKELGLWGNTRWAIMRYFDAYEPIDVDDITFLKVLGISVTRLDKFNSCLVNKLDNLVDDDNNEHSLEIKSLREFIVFHNNLMVSKVKHFFFREMPNKHENSLFEKPELEVYELGKKILNKLNKKQNINKILSNELKGLIFQYSFYFLMLYDMIYNSQARKAIFLKFEYEKNKFKKIKERIENILEKVNNKYTLRFFLKTLALDVLDININSKLSAEDDKSSISSKYRELFNKLKENKVYIEPFTWHIVNVLWKTDGLLQDADEFLQDESIQINQIIKKVKAYVQEFLDIAEKAYIKTTDDLWYNLYNIETNFFNIFYNIEIDESPAKSRNSQFTASGDRRTTNDFKWLQSSQRTFACPRTEKFTFCRRLIDKQNKNQSIKQTIKKVDCFYVIPSVKILRSRLDALKDAIHCDSKLQPLTRKESSYESECNELHKLGLILQEKYRDEGVLKLENLIEDEKIGFDNLNTLFTFYTLQTDTQDGEASKIIGFYSSGVFLGHILNIFQNKLNRCIWLYKIFPHVNIEPNHNHDKQAETKSFLVCDESLKTAFSLQTMINSVYRHKHEINKIFLSGIFDFSKYEKARIHDNQYKYRTIFKVDQDECIICASYIYKNFNKNVEKILELNGDFFSKLEVKLDKLPYKKRVNMSYFLTNTNWVLWFAHKCVDNIEEKLKTEKKKEVLLFAPSHEGRTLLFMVAYLLLEKKIQPRITLKSWKKFKNSKDILKVGIDLSYHSGFTLDYQFAVFINEPFESERKKYFDCYYTLRDIIWH